MTSLVAAVQYHCDVADARDARELSLGSDLLQMREFCRWQLDLPEDALPDRQRVAIEAQPAH